MKLIYDIRPLTKSITTDDTSNGGKKLSYYIEPKVDKIIDLKIKKVKYTAKVKLKKGKL